MAALLAHAADGPARVVSYPLPPGKEDSTIFGFAQAADGTLYFAANSLLTFDGDHWTSATPIPHSFALRNIALGRDGRVWTAAMGDLGWFEKGTKGEWVFHSIKAHLPAPDSLSEVWSVYPDSRGEGATFLTQDQVLRWDGKRFKIWHLPGGRRLYGSSADGTIFAYHEGSGLYRLEDNGPALFLPKESLQEAPVLWTERQRNGWLFGTRLGLLFHDGTGLREFAPEAGALIREHNFTTAVRLPDGRLAIGTVDGGIIVIRPDGELDYQLTSQGGLPSNLIAALFVDRDGALWASTSRQVVRIKEQRSALIFAETQGLPRQAHRNIVRSNGTLAVADETGVYLLSRDETSFTGVPELRGTWKHLLPTPDGLLVSGFKGTHRLTPDGRVSNLYTSSQDTFFCTPSLSRPGEYFVVDNRSVVAVEADGSSRIVAGPLQDNIISLAEDGRNRLWLGTLARGLFVVDVHPAAKSHAIPVGIEFGLPKLSGRVHVRRTPDDGILIFADNGGWQLAPGRGTFSPIAQYPHAPGVIATEAIAGREIWTAHPATSTRAAVLGRIFVTPRSARWEPYSIEGLADIGSPLSIYAETGAGGKTVVWVGGTSSILRHSVERNRRVPPPRPPLLRGYLKTGNGVERVPIASEILPAVANVEFELASPEFARRAQLRLETRIDGIDRDWIPLGSHSTRELSAVREGDFRIRARVVAETGAVSAETVFAFHVPPPWWASPLAFVGFGSALLLAGYGLYRLRLRALRRRNAELEEKVRVRTEELEAANAAKTDFVANMSHDIRNPLNGIVGLALALEDSRLDHRQREIVATLRECTTYLSSLVDDVLDFASIEAGRVELRPGPFAPGQLLSSIVTTLKADTAERGATLTFQVDPTLPPLVLGDAGRVQQILVNFVSNALKYAGGTIHLTATRPAGAPDEIEFSVRDHGPGISPAEQATLFKKFTRLKRKGQEDITGAGLGLAACRLLADLMGGSVDVESSPGHGSRFYLRLPLTVATAAPAPALSHLPNTTVLLVEDADYNAWAATAVLARLGLTADRARCGEEALQMFGQKTYNLVLLDRNLPDIDGIEVARRIRDLESDGRRSLILAITAYCTAEDRQLCLDAGMDAFVGKPITPEKLRRALLQEGGKLLAAATTTVAEPAPSAELDLSLLSYLADGSEDGFTKQVTRFLESLSHTHADLVESVNANNSAALADQAHQLLGQARIVGSTSLAAAATRLENAARSADLTACRQALELVRREIRNLTAAMSHRPESTLTA